MRCIIHFSARPEGNCGDIARYLARPGDEVVYYAALNAHPCAGCGYECFSGPCKYRDDGVYALYARAAQCDQIILVVPMYGGTPSSLYFAFCERGQDYFRTEEAWTAFVERLYIIGVYGAMVETPDFIPCLERWFTGTAHTGHVLGLERHAYRQRMDDRLLDVPEIRARLDAFLP